ncbi:MerR family transcriptional regulator [Akkermansia sp. AKK6]
MAIEDIRNYIELCREGDSSIEDRAEIIFRQKKRLRRQMIVLKDKEQYCREILERRSRDICNPASFLDRKRGTSPD